MEDDAKAAFGVGPGDGTCFVAHEVASAALKAVFVVKQNAAIARWNEQICWTGNDTFTGCAAAARIAVDSDVCAFMNTELSRFDAFLK